MPSIAYKDASMHQDPAQAAPLSPPAEPLAAPELPPLPPPVLDPPVTMGPQAAPNPGLPSVGLIAPAPELPPPSFATAFGGGEHPPEERASNTFLVVVTVLSLAADLGSKAWAKGRLSGPNLGMHGRKPLTVWKDHFEFIFAQNPGGAWSFLRGLPDTLRRPFFLVVSAAAIIFIISIYQRIHRDQGAMRWGLPLALGGAMGNLADRMRYGWVVDFIDFQYKGHHWPTFNVADIAIVVGVLLMGVDMVRARRHHGHEHAPATA